MAKLYKVRKKCMICGNIFYPRYAGSLYCETCKNKKKEAPKIVKKKAARVKVTKKAVRKAVKTRKAVKIRKPARKTKPVKRSKSSRRKR